MQGQATLFEGDSIRTSYLATRLNLKNGSKYVLGIDSGATVLPDGLLLRYGSLDVIGGSRPSRARVSSFEVSVDKPGSAATVYATEKDRLTVLVRSGEATVCRTSGDAVATLSTGKLVTFKLGAGGTVKADSDRAVSELTRVQSDQLSTLVEAAKGVNCLSPKTESMLRQFANLSSQVAANEVARSAILGRIEAGIGTPADRANLSALDIKLRELHEASGEFSSELDDVIYQFHHPGPPAPFTSPHTVHGHVNQFPHHGQHGHTITGPPGDTPLGHHQPPPHHP